MSIALRILLIVVSVFSMVIMMRKIRQSKFQIEYAIFWILFALILIVMAVFPTLTIRLATLIGIQSPVNMVFLMIIFVLMAKLFYLNIQISHLEYTVKELVQKLALNEHHALDSEAESSDKEAVSAPESSDETENTH